MVLLPYVVNNDVTKDIIYVSILDIPYVSNGQVPVFHKGQVHPTGAAPSRGVRLRQVGLGEAALEGTAADQRGGGWMKAMGIV